VLAILVVACAVPPSAVVGPEGRLDVLAPPADFTLSPPPADWETPVASPAALAGVRVVRHDGVPALRIATGGAPFLALRRTRAMLLASSYLSWSWNMESHGGPFHPVHLLVGFSGGPANGGQARGGLPEHDRLLALTWSETALRRGDFPLPAAVPRYVVRGGRVNTGTWWVETIDLADLYARAWPDDDRTRVEVAFIAIASGGEDDFASVATGHVAGLMLNR
jgi:hypothetical protein